jgi:aldehyde dehydrogenase (NAD+)
VFNVVIGPGSVGEAILRHPSVSALSFTGSEGIGRKLRLIAAERGIRIQLEMGGKNPLVVLKDADLDYAVNASAFGIFFHQGQVCMASSRIIVEAPLYEAFLERFVAKARTIKVGDPRDPATVIGPLIRQSQCGFIADQIDDAVSKGATVCCGGTHQGPFFDATVLGGVTPAMSVYGEESFGPITSVLRADDYEHALFLANDTQAGLSSAVVTNDLQKALDFALRSESGMVHINDTTISDEPHIDFGGVKESGFGREGGMASIEEMTEVKWITIQMGKREFPF